MDACMRESTHGFDLLLMLHDTNRAAYDMSLRPSLLRITLSRDLSMQAADNLGLLAIFSLFAQGWHAFVRNMLCPHSHTSDHKYAMAFQTYVMSHTTSMLSMRSMRGGSIFRNRGPTSLDVMVANDKAVLCSYQSRHPLGRVMQQR